MVRLFTNSDIVINEIPMDNYFFWVHDKMNEKYTELTLFLLLLISSFLFIVINLKFKIIDNLVEKKEKLNNLILVLIALFSLYRLANSSKFVSYEIIVYSLLLYISFKFIQKEVITLKSNIAIYFIISLFFVFLISIVLPFINGEIVIVNEF